MRRDDPAPSGWRFEAQLRVVGIRNVMSGLRFRIRLIRRRLAREKFMNQMAIHYVDIIPRGLERLLIVTCKGNKKIVQTAQGFSKGEFELFKARGMLFRVNIFRVQQLLAGLGLVAILLEDGERIR